MDAGSTYEPYPTLKYRWDPKRSVRHDRQYNVQGSQGVDLGPHLADPMVVHDGSQVEDEHLEGPNMTERRAPARIFMCIVDVEAYRQRIHLLEIPHTDSAYRT